jgi:beta-galactosidase GanA
MEMIGKARSDSRIIAFLLASLILGLVSGQSISAQPSMPHLRRQGTATQLIVGGKPFLIRGGELGNSSASSPEYMKPVWPKLASMNLNTVLMPVYWELIEPEEGRFDFTLVDRLIGEARKNNLKIIPLWFASWKNSMSCYAPAWVKTNQKRFPRAESRDGKGMEIMSPFSEENAAADARAFKAFMRHLKEFDARENTVIMIQVENEIGMIPDSRDRRAAADKLFGEQVPAALINYLQPNREKLIPEFRAVWAENGFKTRGTWEEVFGRGAGTDEIFMAWYFARYTNRVAEAGKSEYNLPMFVNAALIRPNYQPGQYPSAGPLPHLMDVWRAAAPQIDFLAPDIYFPNVAEWTRKYDRSGNPLFIPEIQFNQFSSVNAFYAVGAHDAMGFSPFAIENGDEPLTDSMRQTYDVLRQLEPLILENQGKGKMAGLLAESVEQRQPQKIFLNGYALSATYERPPNSPLNSQSTPPASGALVIVLGADEFIFAGTGTVITFETDSPGAPIVGILSADEGKFENGQWKPGRRLNGDQTHQGRHIRLETNKITIQRVKLYRYQ